MLDATVKAFPVGTPIACPRCWGENDIRKANPGCEGCGGTGVPTDYPTRLAGSLVAARKRLTELKKQKRHPGNLLTLVDSLRRPDDPLAEDVETFDRLRRHPKGAEAVLAALEAERRRLTEKHGSVGTHFERQQAQRKNATVPRARSDKGEQLTIGKLVHVLRRENPDALPNELWPELKSAIEATYGKCEESADGRGMLGRCYRYPFWSNAKGKTIDRRIKYKHFRDLLGTARRRVAHTRRVCS